MFLGVVPGRAAGGHGDGHKDAGDDATDEQCAEGNWAEDESDDNRYNHWD